jgi:hypothetical protein
MAAAGVAVLLAVGLYGARAGWFTSETTKPPIDVSKDKSIANALEAPLPPQEVAVANSEAANSGWTVTPGAQVVAVGGADGPSNAMLEVRDGRAYAAIRVPRARADGTNYVSYSFVVRSGARQLYGNQLAVIEAPNRNPEAIALTFNADLLRSIGADREPIVVVVGASDATGKYGEQLGMVQLTLPPTS